MTRLIKIDLDVTEHDALCQAAKEQLRPVAWQAEYYIREGLRLHGFLPPQESRSLNSRSVAGPQ